MFKAHKDRHNAILLSLFLILYSLFLIQIGQTRLWPEYETNPLFLFLSRLWPLSLILTACLLSMGYIFYANMPKESKKLFILLIGMANIGLGIITINNYLIVHFI